MNSASNLPASNLILPAIVSAELPVPNAPPEMPMTEPRLLPAESPTIGLMNALCSDVRIVDSVVFAKSVPFSWSATVVASGTRFSVVLVWIRSTTELYWSTSALTRLDGLLLVDPRRIGGRAS